MTLLALLAGSTLALATAPLPSGRSRAIEALPADASSFDLATIEHQQTFVQTTRDEVSVRVGLVMVDHGGSTDVSPRASLYLTLFAESEMRDHAGLYRLTDLNRLVSAKRTSAGMYEIVLKRYDLDQTLDAGFEPTVRMQVDAREATIDLRSMKGVDELSTGRLTTAIKVEESAIR